MDFVKDLQKLEKTRKSLITQLRKKRLMVRGSYLQYYRKCGKLNCKCVKGKGHLFRRIAFSDKGHTRTIKIPKQDVAWIKKVTNNYRLFTQLLQQLAQVNSQIKTLLIEARDEMLTATKILKDYL